MPGNSRSPELTLNGLSCIICTMSLIEKPYIGVTGISMPEEAEIIAETFSTVLPEDASHQGMSGYLVTSKTLGSFGERSAKYPNLDNLPELLKITNGSGLNVIHYATSDKDTLSEQILRLFTKSNIYADGLCQALQLNISWPDVNELESIRTAMPDLKLVLALTPKIVREETRFDIEDRITDYQELVDFVLVDPSGGNGGSFESTALTPIYTSIKDAMRTQTIIISGGFSEGNILLRLTELAYLFRTKQFGIDAEARLRERTTADPTGRKLSLPKTVSYIKTAAVFFNTES